MSIQNKNLQRHKILPFPKQTYNIPKTYTYNWTPLMSNYTLPFLVHVEYTIRGLTLSPGAKTPSPWRLGNFCRIMSSASHVASCLSISTVSVIPTPSNPYSCKGHDIEGFSHPFKLIVKHGDYQLDSVDLSQSWPSQMWHAHEILSGSWPSMELSTCMWLVQLMRGCDTTKTLGCQICKNLSKTFDVSFDHSKECYLMVEEAKFSPTLKGMKRAYWCASFLPIVKRNKSILEKM